MLDQTILVLGIVFICISCCCCCYYFGKEQFTSAFNSLFQPTKKILIVSCFGYGNIGDEMYGRVFQNYLADSEVVIVSDHSKFVDKDKKIFSEIPNSTWDFDALIIGGGGLITANKINNSRNISYYSNYAMENKKKLYIISCGIQGDISNFNLDFNDWKPLFDYASLITVRSPKDERLIKSMSNNDNVKYIRDLGYLAPYIDSINLVNNRKKHITVIPAGPVNPSSEVVQSIVNNSNTDTVYIVNMGGRGDTSMNWVKNADFKNKKMKKKLGSGKLKEIYTENLNGDLDLNETINIIYNSEFILTGRYHGMIFSRSLNKPYNTLGMGTNKILWELPIEEDMINDSYEHIDLLKIDLYGNNKQKSKDLNNIKKKRESLFS